MIESDFVRPPQISAWCFLFSQYRGHDRVIRMFAGRKRIGTVALIVLFWIATMVWLIRYEAFPAAFGLASSGYRGLLDRGDLIMDRWMTITFNNKSIGYTHTQMDVDEQSSDKQTFIENETFLQLQMLGQSQKLRINTRATIDVMHHLQTFTMVLSAPLYSVSISGKRVRGERFQIVIKTGELKQSFVMDIPDDVVIYSPMTELAIQKLEPGQRLRLKTLNPATMSIDEIVVQALRREKLKLKDKEYDATVLSTEFQGRDLLSWIDAQGQLLRQETPIGWTLEACEPADALNVTKATESIDDLLLAMAVPCFPPIPSARTATTLRLRLIGPGLAKTVLSNHRQKIVRMTDTNLDVTIMAEGIHPVMPVTNPAPPEVVEFLKSTPFIQSDHPDLVRQARKITGDEPTPMGKAYAIQRWVYTHVQKKPTFSLPSALDVLSRLEGDCNEHTYLYVGLARAAGLPAKVVVGLTYNDGAFYYHAWPAVYAGQWVEMDPTFGQQGVDATHVGLLEGELASQVKLIGILGRLQIQVLPEKMQPGRETKKP